MGCFFIVISGDFISRLENVINSDLLDENQSFTFLISIVQFSFLRMVSCWALKAKIYIITSLFTMLYKQLTNQCVWLTVYKIVNLLWTMQRQLHSNIGVSIYRSLNLFRSTLYIPWYNMMYTAVIVCCYIGLTYEYIAPRGTAEVSVWMLYTDLINCVQTITIALLT